MLIYHTWLYVETYFRCERTSILDMTAFHCLRCIYPIGLSIPLPVRSTRISDHKQLHHYLWTLHIPSLLSHTVLLRIYSFQPFSWVSLSSIKPPVLLLGNLYADEVNCATNDKKQYALSEMFSEIDLAVRHAAGLIEPTTHGWAWDSRRDVCAVVQYLHMNNIVREDHGKLDSRIDRSIEEVIRASGRIHVQSHLTSCVSRIEYLQNVDFSTGRPAATFSILLCSWDLCVEKPVRRHVSIESRLGT